MKYSPKLCPPAASRAASWRIAAWTAMAAVALAAAPPLQAQNLASFEPAPARDNAFALTLESIMRGSEHVGQAPVGVSWSDDGEWIYFRWLPGGAEWHEQRALYRVRSTGGTPERVDDEEELRLGPILAPGDVSPDGRWRVTSSGGDLYLIERDGAATRRLTHTQDAEMSPVFSGDGASIFFRRGNNLFAFDIDDGEIRQLTSVGGPEQPEDPEAEGHKAFLEEQQRELFEHIRVQDIREERADERRELREAGQRETLHLAQGERAQSFAADPTGSHVAVTVTRGGFGGEGRSTDIPLWVTQSGYTENTEMRAKVGDEQGVSRLAVVDTGTGEATWLDLTGDGSDADSEETESADAEADSDEAGSGEAASDDRLAVASFAGWNDAGSHGLVFAVDYDYKTWRLYAFEAATGSLTLLDTHHDEAWVGGPCFGFQGAGCIGWLPAEAAGDVPRAWYVSEETGYSHLYAVDADGGDKEALTAGEWEVLGATIPDGWDAFLLQTSELSPFDQHPWRMGFDGSDRVQLLEGEGSFTVTPSPDGRRFAVLHSRANRPPELYLADAAPGAAMTQVTTSPTETWLGFPWLLPEIVHFEARDGTPVPARIYRPADFGVEPNGAGVIFVHGAGYLHNVHNWWSNYYREYMFHHFLAAQGYTVLDIDYRGSAGYGRDWRTAIYRHMGGWDLSDQVDGAAYLAREEGVDPDRMGIYGGSYGGFITLMALFTAPQSFAAGGALRSVTDWAHYNHWYTSRILNLPHEDEEAYRQSSPIYFAEGLEGHLLIAHGMYDTNVHFSDVVRLAQRLIELGKENWEMAVYPVENHGFAEPSSWTDEYRRIYELFERVIGGGRGASANGEGG
ncbi:MAG: prolyl oligopeptidase family serine peptidase [Gemmatimonadales bacterium]|nr:prolyl oligopeptidase family serine peptidase [Candidatus Palauibacter irciniicola]MYC18093.1 prolyl oligopeptidase family serine peptidase [Gemmatimonadales bacterium]